MRQPIISSVLHRFKIGRHLALCFVFLIGMMVICDGVLLWQLREVRSQVEVLKGVDGELIEVLRVHGDLFSFYERLGRAARSEDHNQLITVSEALRSGILDQLKRTETVFSHLPPDVKVDQTVLPTVETIEYTLLSHLNAIQALAASGDWADVQGRTDKQIERLEFLSSQLVTGVARDVEEQRTQSASNIARVEHRIVFITIIAGFVTLFTAAFVGWATALRILELRMEATKRVEVERERLRELEDDLAHMNRVGVMGEMAASIAHELNQPLSGVVVNGNACMRWLAGDSPNLEEARENARRIVRDGKRAGEIIARVRAQATKTATAMTQLDMNEAVEEVIALAQPEVRRNNVTLQTELAGDLWPVWGDRVQLQQVLLNLVMNAVEAMSTVEERPRELVIRTQNDEADLVRVTVQDSGTGLDPQSTERIFDAFYTTKSGGMGMGLSICRSIVQKHGGGIVAVANDGPGTTFQFTVQRYEVAVGNSIA